MKQSLASDSTSPCSKLNQSALSAELIFSCPLNRIQKSSVSALRYSSKPQLKSGKFLNYADSFSKAPHFLGVPIRHQKTVSDADCVLLESKDNSDEEVQTEGDLKYDHSCIRVRDSSMYFKTRTSLTSRQLGPMPTTAYCPSCKREVHTDVVISSKLWQIFASFAACCQGPSWLNNMRTHLCPRCQSELGKCRKRWEMKRRARLGK